VKTLPQEAFGQVNVLPFLGFSSIWEMVNPPVEVNNNYPFIVLMNSKLVPRLLEVALMRRRSKFLEIFNTFGVT
jgi:hypothetical protein